MLNDWSDRPRKRYRKGLFGSREFMIGAAAMMAMLAILAGVVASFIR